MVIELLAGTMRRGRGGIAAVEDDMRQTYTVKHIRKGLTLLSFMKPLLLSLVTSISLPFLADAMPTAEEIAAAEPLVQEVMKAEMDALRSGKKTREQVGDAAVALASLRTAIPDCAVAAKNAKDAKN